MTTLIHRAVRSTLTVAATLVTLTTANLLAVAPAQAREVAVCTSGFSIATTGNKAFCQRTEESWVTVGNRHCALNGIRVSDEANDGGDKCKGRDPLTAMVSGPALLCELDPAYGPGHRTNMVRNGVDTCQRKQRVTEFGDIATRNE